MSSAFITERLPVYDKRDTSMIPLNISSSKEVMLKEWSEKCDPTVNHIDPKLWQE